MLHAGDLVASSVLEELSELGRVEAVVGNMDDDSLRARLPVRNTVEVEGVRIGMLHDAGPRSGREQRLADAFPDCSLVVYGHTHVPQLRRHEGIWILNPGSPTERRSAPTHSMALLHVSGEGLEPQLIPL